MLVHRAVAARRRGEDEPQGLRRVRADRARRRRRTPASIPARGASAIHELAHQILARRGAAGSRPRHQRQRRRDLRRHAAERRRRARTAPRSTSGCRRWRTRARSRPMRSALRPVDSADRARGHRRVRAAAARTNGGRRASLSTWRERWRATLGRELRGRGTGGGSDGNFTAALGVPTLDGLGPAGRRRPRAARARRHRRPALARGVPGRLAQPARRDQIDG